MPYKLLFAAGIITITLISCAGEAPNYGPAPAENLPAAPAQPEQTTISAQGDTVIVPQNMPAPPPPIGQGAKVVKLNPEHGAPGHRCDIAVGAPIDAPSTQAQIPQQPTNITSTPVSVAPTPQKVAKGMNPEHGQPGHRCDIAVGAPLSTPMPTTPTQGNVTQPTFIPVKPDSGKN